MNRRELAFLKADVESTRNLLQRLGPGRELEKIGLKSRLESLEVTLSAATKSPIVEAALTFGGAPVRAQRGIETGFAAIAVREFQSLVAKIGSSRTERLPDFGPVPDGREFQLHVTDIARGSFGFVLEGLEDESGSANPAARTALSATASLLDRLKGSDETFEEAFVELDQRVVVSLKAFIDHLAKSRASLKVGLDDRSVSLSDDDVALANARVSSSQTNTVQTKMHGKLVGFLPEKKLFEWKGDAGEIISGRFGHEVGTTEELQASLNVPAHATLEITTVTHRGKAGKSVYLLKKILPVQA